MRPLNEQSVVITGASSGIGRKTAIEFGRRGAMLTLAARNEEALNETAEEVRAAGGKAHVVVTDVAEWDQVERLAQQAAEHWGRIDTWVNNAAVTVNSLFETLSIAEIDRIIRVDLLGQIYGAKAALPHLRRAEGGTLINVSSEVGLRAVPLQSIYCAAKHGIKGFTEALRMELEHEGSPIQVTLILPSGINTPFFDHARSKMGVRPKPPGAVYEPEVVADAIVFAAENPRREIFVGAPAKSYDILQRISPRLVDRMMLAGGHAFHDQMSNEPDSGFDNLFEPPHGAGSTRGDFAARSSSWYTRTFEHHPEMKAVAAGVAVGAVAALLGSTLRRGAERRSLQNGWSRRMFGG